MKPRPPQPPVTAEQVVAAFQATLGAEPRPVDILLMVDRMHATAEDLAEYIWDHWMGEPDSPTLAQVEREVRRAIKGVQ